MTALDTIETLVRAWQHDLDLDHWTITLHPGADPDQTTYMSVDRPRCYNRARINIAAWILDPHAPKPDDVLDDPRQDPAALETIVVHELIHLCLQPLARTDELLDGLLHRDVHAVYQTAAGDALEQSVDHIAAALARHHPKTPAARA